MPDPDPIAPATTPDAPPATLLRQSGMTRQEILELADRKDLREELRSRLYRNLELTPDAATYYQSPADVRDNLLKHALLPEYTPPEFGMGTFDQDLKDAIDKINLVGTEVIEREHAEVFGILKNCVSISAGSSNPHVITNESAVNNVATAADPVNLANGAFVYSTTDFHIAGAGIDLVFERHYSQIARYNGPLGFNWDHAYNLWLRVSDDSNLIYRSTGALTKDLYRRHEDHDYFVPADGGHGVILEGTDGFVLRLPDGRRIVYEPHESSDPFLHVVQRIEDRFGNALRFFYVDGNLARIEVNHVNRFIELLYDSDNRISVIVDFSGRRWTYAYDDLGDLVGVADPTCSGLARAVTAEYQYSSSLAPDPDSQHNLIAITDSKGQLYLENEYGAERNMLSYNRVVRQRQGGGDFFFEYSDVIEQFDFPYPIEQRPAHQTVLTERDGRSIRYLFNALGNMILKEEIAVIGGIPTAVSWHYRYNRDGNLIGTISPLGAVVQYLYAREMFERQFDQPNPYFPERDPNLTATVRQRFGNLLAVVHRGTYINLHSFISSQPLWSGDIFPDIFDTNPEDVIQKYTYEDEFNQLLTASDPRVTENASPDHQESAEYHRRLARHTYSPGDGHQSQFLSSIELPAATLPDGSSAGPSVTQFTDFDSRGRPTRMVSPNGLVTQTSYFGTTSGTREGFLRGTEMDAGGISVRSEVRVDAHGRIIKTFRPPFFSFQDDRFVSINQLDVLGRISKMTGTAPFAISTFQTRDQNGNVVESKVELKDVHNAPAGSFTVTSRYDEEFNLTSQISGDPDRQELQKARWVYDRAGRKILTIADSGMKERTTYNERSLVSKVVADHGGIHAVTRQSYDADGRLVRASDPRRHATRYAYDPLGRAVRVDDAAGNVRVRHYDKMGNILVECFFQKNPGGDFSLLSRQEASYDEVGRKITGSVNRFETVAPVTESELFTSFVSAGPGELITAQFFYNIVGDLFKYIDEEGREFQTEFDVLGRVIRDVDPYGNERRIIYDKESNVTRIDRIELKRDPLSDAILDRRFFAEEFRYDELNRLLEAATPAGRVRFQYDSCGNTVEIVDVRGFKTTNHFDAFGRTIQSARELSHDGLTVVGTEEVQYVYGRDGQVATRSDPLGRRTRFEYDALGRLLRTILPDGSMDHSIYDRAGNKVRYTDRNGVSTELVWDALNRNVSIRVDTSAAVHALAPAATRVQSTEFDGLGRNIRATNDFVVQEFRYDSLNNLIEEKTGFSNITGVNTGSVFALRRSYNRLGVPVRLHYPSGRDIRYELDRLERITRIIQFKKGSGYPGDATIPDGATLAEIAHRGLNRASVTLRNGSRSRFQHDFNGRLIEIIHEHGNREVLKLQYLYDGCGNVRRQSEMLEGIGRTSKLEYDSTSRLVRHHRSPSASLIDLGFLHPRTTPLPADIPDLQEAINQIVNTPMIGAVEITYDACGNRVHVSNGPTVHNYQTNESDQYQKVDGEEHLYDPNGNLIEDGSCSYRYNHRNQLARIQRKEDGAEAQYVYDNFGRPCVRIVGGVPTVSIFDGDELLEEYENHALRMSAILDPGAGKIIALSRDGAELYHFQDLIGSTRCVMRDAAMHATFVFDEFGVLESPAQAPADTPFLFGGHRRLELGDLYSCLFRTYKPGSGRFIQRDPAGFVDGTNLYSYVNNNPASFVDPVGLQRRHASGETILVEGDIEEWRPDGWDWLDGAIAVTTDGGMSGKARRRYKTLTEHQTWARGIMDRGWGCTGCHVSVYVWNTLGPSAINPDNMLPYDSAINRQGFDEWVMNSARARFFVEGMTMIAKTKQSTTAVYERAAMQNFMARSATPVAPVSTTASLVEREVAALRTMAQQPLSGLDIRLYRAQFPTITINYTGAAATVPGDANFLRFNMEWAQTSGPLRVGHRNPLDNSVRARARRSMDRSGFDRSGLNAMHPLDSVGNPWVRHNTQIGSTYYFGNSSVNQSFGSQVGNAINGLGLRTGDRFWVRFSGFPDYSVAPPIAPPSSPPNL